MFTIFYIFGLNSYISFNEPIKKRSIRILYLPRIINFGLPTFVIAYCIYTELFTFQNMLFFNMLIYTAYVAFFESIIHVSGSFRGNLQIMCNAINRLEMNLKMKYPLNVIQKSFRRKFTLQIAIILGGYLFKYLIPSEVNISPILDVTLTLTILYKCIHLFHAIIYVDFIKFTLMCMCQKIVMVKSEVSRKVGDKSMQRNMRMMRQIKLIHFKLWHIAERVNQQFGWFLTVFPIDAVSTITHSIYWFSIGLTIPNHSTLSSFRKKWLLLDL